MNTLDCACHLLTCWILIDTLMSPCGKEMSVSGTWQHLLTGAMNMQAHPHMHTGYAPWCAQKSSQTAYNPVQGHFGYNLETHNGNVAVTLSAPYQVSPGVKWSWRNQLRMLLCRDVCAYSGRVCPHDSVQRPKQALRLLRCDVCLRIAQPVQRCYTQRFSQQQEDCRFPQRRR